MVLHEVVLEGNALLALRLEWRLTFYPSQASDAQNAQDAKKLFFLMVINKGFLLGLHLDVVWDVCLSRMSR